MGPTTVSEPTRLSECLDLFALAAAAGYDSPRFRLRQSYGKHYFTGPCEHCGADAYHHVVSVPVGFFEAHCELCGAFDTYVHDEGHARRLHTPG